MTKLYKSVYDGEEDGDFVVDPDGDVLVFCSEPSDASLLVEHLNEPLYGGGYTIEDPEDDEDEGDEEPLFTLLDPEGDDIFYHESRAVLETLISHLNRRQ